MIYSEESWQMAFKIAKERLERKKMIEVIDKYNRIPQKEPFNSLPQGGLKRPAQKQKENTPPNQPDKPPVPTDQNTIGQVVGTNVPTNVTITDVIQPMTTANQAAKDFGASAILRPFAQPPTKPVRTNPNKIINSAVSSSTMTENRQNNTALDQNQINQINASISAMPSIEAKCIQIRNLLATGFYPEISGLGSTKMATKLDIFNNLVKKLPHGAGRIDGDNIFEIEVNSIINILTNKNIRKTLLKNAGAKPSGEKDGIPTYSYKEVVGTIYPELIKDRFKWFFTVESVKPDQYVLIAIDPIPLLHASLDKKTGELKAFWSNNKRIVPMDSATNKAVQQ